MKWHWTLAEIKLCWTETHKKYRLWLGGSLLFFAGSLLVSYCVYHHTKHNQFLLQQNQQSTRMLQELNTIQSQLEAVADQTHSRQEESALTAMNTELATLRQLASSTAKTADIEKVSNDIASIKQSVETHAEDLQNALTANGFGQAELPASALPFKVVSVDILAGLPYVSVDYAHHTAPIAIGESLAGWRLMAVDDDIGAAEWMNDKNQHVKLFISSEA